MSGPIWRPRILPHRLNGRVLDVMLPMQTSLAELCLDDYSNLPRLYDLRRAGRLRYIPDQLGVNEAWLAPNWIVGRGGADCKSLAAWRAAELRREGDLNATPVHLQQGRIFHVVVRRGDGVIEDPSTLCGMQYPASWVW